MIKLVTDKKIIKKVKQGLLTGGHAVCTNNFIYNGQHFRKILLKHEYQSAELDILNYCLCSSYNDLIKIFNIEKSSFIFTTYRQYKHNVLTFEYKENTYYFSISFNKERGLDFYFYPHMINDCPVDLSEPFHPDSSIFLYFEPAMYSFHRELYLMIVNYIADNSLIDETFNNVGSRIDDIRQIFQRFNLIKDFNLIMPELD